MNTPAIAKRMLNTWNQRSPKMIDFCPWVNVPIKGIMKSLLWSLLCFFSSFALACPTPPAYYNQDVCQFVQEHSTSFKTDILRIQLKAHAIRRKQTMDLTEQCQIKLAYTVCGARFVGQELAENIFFNGDTNQIQELIKRSKKYIASNSDWMKRLIEKESFGNDHKADEIRVILYEENLLPKETNLFKFTNNFQDKSKIPTGLRSLLEQHQSIEKRFWDPEFDKSLNSGSGTDWVAVFKRNPELAKKIQEEIDMLPFEERKFQTFRLETVKKSPPKQRKARMDFLQQKLTTLNQNNGWPTSESDQFQRTLAETSPLTNSEAISLMKTMVEKKQSNNFPETIFWKLFNEIQDEGLTNPDREDLMMILYQMDNTAWAKKALSSLSTSNCDDQSLSTEIM